MAQKAEIANQQKTLRAKAAQRTTGASSHQLDHFEKLDVVSKASFGLLGGMAGDLFNAKGRLLPGVMGGLPNAEYLAACKEFFEELCASIDLPQSILGQCVNACDKLVIDSRPKKIKTGKIDSAMADKLEGDNMGEEEGSSGSPTAGASKKKKHGTIVEVDGGNSDNDEGAAAGAGDDAEDGEMLDEAQIEERKKQEETKRLAEEAEQAALRKSLEEEEKKRVQAEENEAKLKANARVVSSDVPIGMAVMKRDDDDDDLAAFANMGKGKKGGKGGRK